MIDWSETWRRQNIMDVNILPSLTTTNHEVSRVILQQLEQNPHIKEIGLFITGLNFPKERMHFLQFIKEKLPEINIPFCHVRLDSEPEELDFLINNFSTKYFNIHGNHSNDFEKTSIFKYKDMMLAENSHTLNKNQMRNFSGCCIDLSHYYEDLKNNKDWIEDLELAADIFPIKANHISAVRKGNIWYAEHINNYKSDMDYLKEIDHKYFGEYLCLELENTLLKQLDIIDYIKTIL